jgi:uncharacterized protein with FMN-binding domain
MPTGTARLTNSITVTVTLTASKITGVTAVKSVPTNDAESISLYGKIDPKLFQDAIAANSATIANASGATFWSNAFKSSLQAALTASGR